MKLVLVSGKTIIPPMAFDADLWELGTIKRLAVALGVEVVGADDLTPGEKKALKDVGDVRSLGSNPSPTCLH